MDTAPNVEDVREEIVPYGEQALPTLLDCLPRLRRWEARNACVATALKFARVSDLSRRLGFVGLADKSKRVRQTACALAAFSLDRAFLTSLREIESADDPQTAANAGAAITAIERQNHHLFVDRQGTGRSHWWVAGAPAVGP